MRHAHEDLNDGQGQPREEEECSGRGNKTFESSEKKKKNSSFREAQCINRVIAWELQKV